MKANCKLCRLNKQPFCNGYVPPRGNFKDPKIILIGEAPGILDNKEKKPFIDRNGKLLQVVFEQLGFNIEEVCFLTNVVKCCPFADPFNEKKGIRPPTQKEIECCLPLLKKEIEMFDKNKVILMPLGNSALKGLGFNYKITEVVGKELNWNGYKVVPNFHPALILRNPKYKQTFISVFSKVLSNQEKKWKDYVKILINEEAIKFLKDKLSQEFEYVVFDIETDGFDPFENEIIMLSFCFPDDPNSYVIPLYNKKPLEKDDIPEMNFEINKSTKLTILNLTKKLLEKTPVIGHNLKFDLKFMVTKTGLDLSKVVVKDDTLFLSHFVFNKVQLGETLQLKDVAVKILGLDGRWDDEIKEYLKKNYRRVKDRHYANIPTYLLSIYAGLDTLFTKEVYLHLREKIKLFNCDEIREALNKAVIMYVESEIKGVKVDTSIREFLNKKYEEEIREADNKLQELPKIKEWKRKNNIDKFIPTSQIHQKEVAFKIYNLPVVEKTEKGEPSLNKSAINFYLKELPDNSEERRFIELLYKIKLFKKLKSTYIDGFSGELKNEFYHANFNIAGTITGRLSSGFHTIPSKSDLKRMFVSRWKREGGLIISADYSQLEVRVSASLSNETKLIEAYKQGIDVHKRTASMIFNKPEDQITKEERKIAKTAVFGILYGKTAKSLAKDFGVSLKKAEEWINNLFGGYSNLKRWIEEQQEFVLENGFVITAFNRVIPVPWAFSNSKYDKLEAKRKAVNYPVQSSASDLNTTSSVRLWESFKKLGLKSVLIGTVHDAIVIDVYPGELITVVNLIKKTAEKIPNMKYEWLKCPVRIDISIGDSWGSCIEWDLIKLSISEMVVEGSGFKRDLENFISQVKHNFEVEVEKIDEEEFNEPAIDQFLFSDKKEIWKVRIRGI